MPISAPLSDIPQPHPCSAYLHANGTMALMQHMWDRIAQLEAELAKVENRRASDAMAAAYSHGGGHGFG